MGGSLEDDSLYGLILETVDAIINEESGNIDGGGGGGGDSADKNGFFALDPLAGQLYVRTTPGKLRAVAKMLNNLKAKLSRQVVIDARILQVSLDDNWSLGIDWNYVDQRLSAGDSGTTFEYLSRFDNPAEYPNGIGSLTRSGDDVIFKMTGFTKGDIAINAAIEAMQTFGGLKTVANPHVRVRHGQPALFTSGQSEKYVSEISREVDDDNNTTFTVETATVFNGVMLGVICFINDDNKIDMQIYPIKSEVNSSSLEPKAVTGAGDQISLPKVEVKNVSTTVRVSDGDTIILGGLIDKDTGKTDSGVPGLSQVPGLGWLFKSRTQIESVRELVIIMNIRVVQ
jgi:MSHA type pilus biogenesis protein MshL